MDLKIRGDIQATNIVDDSISAGAGIQQYKIDRSAYFDDTLILAEAEAFAGSLLSDLNFIRSQIKNITGEINWNDTPFQTVRQLDSRINNLESSGITDFVVLGGDTYIYRDAAFQIGIRNGANSQQFNLYSTYTDNSHYARLSIKEAGGSFKILAETLNDGTPNNLWVGTFDTGTTLDLVTANTVRWLVSPSGDLLPNLDNIYNLGSPTARIKNIYAATALYESGIFSAEDGSQGTPSYNFSQEGDTGLYRVAANKIGIATGGSLKWAIDVLGTLQTGSDGAYDVGAVSAGRPGDVYVKSLIQIGDDSGSSGLLQVGDGSTSSSTVVLDGSSGVSAVNVLSTLVNTFEGYFFGVVLKTPETTSTATFSVIDQVRVKQFVLPFAVRVGYITSEVTFAGAAGKKYGIGIYDIAGAKLLETGALAADATQINSVEITPVTIPAGVYYLAWTTDDAATILRGVATDANIDAFLNIETTKKTGTAANAAASGVLPATLGTITAGSFNFPLSLFEPSSVGIV